MIEKPVNYIYPCDTRISIVSEFLGYNFYLPEKLLKDICYLAVYHMSNSPAVYKTIYNKSSFQVKYCDLLESINFKSYTGNTPLELAISVLLKLQESYSFRSIDEENENFRGNDLNYKENVSQEDVEYIQMLSSTKESREISEILNMSVITRTIFGSGKENDIVQCDTNIANLKDLLKLRKSELVKPLFKKKLLMKEFTVIKDTIQPLDKNVLVYLEDASYSMSHNKEIIASVKFALTKLNKVVHYIRFTDKILSSEVLTSVEEKVAAFTQPSLNKFYKVSCNYYELFENLSKYHESGDILLVTDTENQIPIEINKKFKLNCVTNKNNVFMKNLVKTTNGKYILL